MLMEEYNSLAQRVTILPTPTIHIYAKVQRSIFVTSEVQKIQNAKTANSASHCLLNLFIFAYSKCTFTKQ